MTELREWSHVCSWMLTEVRPSLQTKANETKTPTDSSPLSNLREIWHFFSLGLYLILSCARECHMIRVASNGIWSFIPTMGRRPRFGATYNKHLASLFLTKSVNGTHVFRCVAWHVQALSPHVLHVNGRVLVCVCGPTRHMSSALCGTAGEQESQDGGPPAKLHQEFLQNTQRKEGGTTHYRRSSWAVFLRDPRRWSEGITVTFTHTHVLSLAAAGDEVTAVALLLCWRPELRPLHWPVMTPRRNKIPAPFCHLISWCFDRRHHCL